MRKTVLTVARDRALWPGNPGGDDAMTAAAGWCASAFVAPGAVALLTTRRVRG